MVLVIAYLQESFWFYWIDIKYILIVVKFSLQDIYILIERKDEENTACIYSTLINCNR